MMHSLRLLTVLLLAPSAAAQVVERAEVTSSGAPFYGQRVVGTGDVDGDGVPDLAVLDPTDGAGPLGSSAGRVFVLSGASLATLHDVGVTGPMEWFQDLAVLGDVDGDGAADLVIGVRGSLGTAGPGRARTISGATGALLHEITGDQADDGLGRSVAGVGDLDGDGWPDVAVGAPSDRTGLSVTGSVRLCSGVDGAQLDIVFGPDADGAFGSAIAGLGDVDGDGVPDLAVGADNSNAPGLFAAGAVHGVSGADGSILWSLYGAGAQELLGGHVAALGDLDGDGVREVGVGSPRFDGPGTGRGVLRVLSGADGTELWSVVGATDAESFGGPLASVGDVTGDGVPDVAVASVAPADPGASPGTVRLLSGANGAEIVRLPNPDPVRFPGAALAGLGDWNGDGVPDFAVGTLGLPTALEPGSVQLYLAGCNAFDVPSCVSLPNSTGQVGTVRAQGCGASLTNGAVELVAEDLPANQAGFFLMSAQPAATPIGAGVLCIGAPFLRMYDQGGIVPSTGPAGRARRVFGLAPLPAGFQVAAGSTWFFQFVHRDSGLPSGVGFQLTSAVGVTF